MQGHRRMYRAGMVKDIVHGDLVLGVEEWGVYVPGLQDFEYNDFYTRKRRALNFDVDVDKIDRYAGMEITQYSRYAVLTSMDYIMNLDEFRSEYLVLEACDQSHLDRLKKINSEISNPSNADAIVLIDDDIFSNNLNKFLLVPRSGIIYRVGESGPPSEISTPELDYDSLLTISNIACSRCQAFGTEVPDYESDSLTMRCNATYQDEEEVYNTGDPGYCPEECPIKKRLANYKPIFTELVKSNL